ncbi:MAG: hypothetical protein H2057_02255 [Alphaproteobacteria bacterium]|nr:hypothetical protein [Alphaproteobacteria bacterium]
MTKGLLGVSAVALLTSLVAFPQVQAASAGDAPKVDVAPKVELSGETNVVYYVFNGKKNTKDQNGGKGNGHHIDIQDARLNVEAIGVAELYGGLEYSALFGIVGDPEDGQTSVEETRIKLRGPWGFLIAGNSRGVDDRMSRGAFSVMGATGGFNGNYDRVVNMSTGVLGGVDMVGTQKDANKLTYVTPRVYGLQAGVSVTPDGRQKGYAKLRTIGNRDSSDKTFDKNNVSLGLNYNHKFANGLGLTATATAVFGNAQIARRLEALAANAVANRVAETFYSGDRKRSASYALGLLLDYGAFDFGIEYVDNGKSQVHKAIMGRNAGYAFSGAIGYKFGVNRVALGYQHTERKLGTGFRHFGVVDIISADNPKARMDVISVTYDRTLAKGLGLFAEGNVMRSRTDSRWVALQNQAKAVNSGLSDGVGKNNAGIVMTGLKVRW